jgi:flavorubredoxin
MTTDNPLPREIAPGIFWIGDCMHIPYDGSVLHSYNTMYLVTGERESLLVESGHPLHLQTMGAQLESLLSRADVPPLRHLFVTHPETPHAGGVPRLMEHYPDLILRGDASNVHLYAPACADRVQPMNVGDEIDLGGTTFCCIPAVIRDHVTTRWGFDTSRRVLFSGDGIVHTHYHDAGQCGHFAEEVPALDLTGMIALLTGTALDWMHYVDVTPYVERFDRLVDELGVEMIASTHGLPISDLPMTLPSVRAGLLASGSKGSALVS